MKQKRILDISGVVLCFAATAGAAAFGGQFATGAWYRELEKPWFTPPDWVFGPAWGFLYLAMAIAAGLVWLRRGSPGTGLGLVLFGLQLILNAAWSALFFGLNWMGIALAEIIVLEGFILATAWAFWRVHRGAAILMAPYAMWVAFAAMLNAGLWYMNP